MLALALGRPLGVEDTDCDVEWPVPVDDDDLVEYFSGSPNTPQRPSLMAGSIALAMLYQIAGRILRQVYALDMCKDHLELDKKAELQRTVDVLDQELTQWCENMPTFFNSEAPTEEQVSMRTVLHSHYYSVLTTLHRNFLPLKREPMVTSTKSPAKAIWSAFSCIRLAPTMKSLVPPSHHLAFFIQHLFSCAVILLLYAMHVPENKAAMAAMDEAKSTLVALESWEGQWPGARKCKELLMELATTATEAINDVTKAKEEPTCVPQSLSGVNQERRRSVTISTPAQGSVPGRMVRSKARRPHSRDPHHSARRAAAASPYRVDCEFLSRVRCLPHTLMIRSSSSEGQINLS
jgi:hypothetical protein